MKFSPRRQGIFSHHRILDFASITFSARGSSGLHLVTTYAWNSWNFGCVTTQPAIHVSFRYLTGVMKMLQRWVRSAVLHIPLWSCRHRIGFSSCSVAERTRCWQGLKRFTTLLKVGLFGTFCEPMPSMNGTPADLAMRPMW